MKVLRADIPHQPMGIIAVASDTNNCESQLITSRRLSCSRSCLKEAELTLPSCSSGCTNRPFFKYGLFFFELFEYLNSPETLGCKMIHFSPSPERISQLDGQFQPSRVSGKLQTPVSAVAIKLFPSFAEVCCLSVYIDGPFSLIPHKFPAEMHVELLK